jgi:hypothetical protein
MSIHALKRRAYPAPERSVWIEPDDAGELSVALGDGVGEAVVQQRPGDTTQQVAAPHIRLLSIRYQDD